MFKFFKNKLKEALSKFSKEVDDEAEDIVDVPEEEEDLSQISTEVEADRPEIHTVDKSAPEAVEQEIIVEENPDVAVDELDKSKKPDLFDHETITAVSDTEEEIKAKEELAAQKEKTKKEAERKKKLFRLPAFFGRRKKEAEQEESSEDKKEESESSDSDVAKKVEEAEAKLKAKEEKLREAEEAKQKQIEEKKRLAEEEKRKKEAEKKRRIAEERERLLAEEQKRKEAELKKKEEERLQKEAEIKKLEEEKRKKEEELRLAEEEKRKKEEQEKIAEEKRQFKEAKKLLAQKKEEAKQLAEEKRAEEEKRLEEEQSQLEEEQKEKEEQRAKEEKKRLEAEEEREKLEEERLQKEAESKKAAEEKRLEEEKLRKAKEEKERLEEEKKKQEEELKAKERLQAEEKKKLEAKKASQLKEEKPAEEKQGFFSKLKQAIVSKKLSEEQFENLFWDLEVVMLESNVAVEVINKIKEDLKLAIVNKPIPRTKIEETITNTLKNSIADLFKVEQIDLLAKIKEKTEKPYVICFVGINGSGKTTTIAKITQLLKKQGYSIVLAAADTFRAAAIDQLAHHAEKLDVKIIKHSYGSDPAAVAFDAIKHAKANKKDVVLIDTAGRLHSNINLIEEMKKIMRVAKPDLKIFVGESITGNDCVQQAQKFNEAIELDAIILSKADIDEKGGASISISYVTGKPILYLGTGQNYDDLSTFDPSTVIESLGL